MLARIVRRVLRRPRRPTEMGPAAGYDRWSSTYDRETGNILIDLDEVVFAGLLERVPLRGKVIADIGCGTGRHWKKILDREPSELVGYDISTGMLAQLRRKYPQAKVYEGSADRLTHTPDASCDFVFSTLTLCHLPDADRAIAEWSRVLRAAGELLLTDYHPATSSSGECSFRSRGEVVTVKLHVHTLASLREAAARHGLVVVDLVERVVDESMKHHYEASGMLPVFDRMNGRPIVYGLHLRKRESTSS